MQALGTPEFPRGVRLLLALLRRLLLLLLTAVITPLLGALSFALLLSNLFHRLAERWRPFVQQADPPVSGIATIIVLNWNGRELLAEALPSVLEAVKADGLPHEVIVVDNGSSDGSAEYVRLQFPAVKVLGLPENLGFAEGNNEGVKAAANDVVVLLNNDMVVDRGFLRPLLEGFGPRTFAVSSQIFLQDRNARREETGKTTVAFRNGMIEYAHLAVEGTELERRYYPVAWAGGGSSAFHRKRFLTLGGFSSLYSPAYVEDADLSYAAWRIGWDVLFAPESVVYHRHRATSKRRFTPAELQRLVQRNQWLFIWKNVASWRLLSAHCSFLPWTCYRLARDHGIGIWRSLPQALAKLPAVHAARRSLPSRALRDDREILETFSNPGRYFAAARVRRIAQPYGGRPRILWLTAYLPHLGRHAGAGRMYQLLERLAQHYRITLLSFLETENEREFLPELEMLCERVIAMRRLPQRRWNLFPYEPFDEFNTPEMRRALNGCLENADYDLIQLEYTQMACYADKQLAIPTLLTCHEVDFAACARRARLQAASLGKVRWFYNYLQVLDRQIKLTRRVDGVICMTDSDQRELRKFCADVPIHVVNTGVDLEYFKPVAIPADSATLVFVGAFRHEPNVDAMIYFCSEILPRIRSQVPETELRIVGSFPPPKIEALGNLPGVTVTGFVPDIRPYMASSSIYVVPLRLGVGIRGKILEAWSMGLPVVATTVASAGLRFRDGQDLLLADSAAQFAGHVVRLLEDSRLRAEIGAAGRIVAERHYGWDAAAASLDKLYRQMAAGRPSYVASHAAR
jgi:GT2 family glycosyltransferase/glycosyltransferase involved in cell wall biosynthesis